MKNKDKDRSYYKKKAEDIIEKLDGVTYIEATHILELANEVLKNISIISIKKLNISSK